MSRNLALRIAVAAVFIPAILWIAYQGGWWLFGMLLLFLLLGMGEYLWGEGWRTGSVVFWAGLLAAGGTFALVAAPKALHRAMFGRDATLPADLNLSGGITVLIGFFLVTAMLFAIGKRTPAELFQRHSRLMWGTIYLCIGYICVFLVGMGAHGWHGGDSLLFLFGVLWIGDTTAMWVGSTMGRHKLAPTVSPNKTVEGFLGGIAGGVLIGLVMYFWKFSDLGLGHVMVVAIGASVFGQLGDLVESMWKRSVGVKDSSAIIPGHGGILDRFDSLLFAAPFMLAYFTLIRP